MTFTWITMFSMVLYVELIDKVSCRMLHFLTLVNCFINWQEYFRTITNSSVQGRTWSEVGRILLAGVAETTNTPITLLALAISVSYACKWIADLTKFFTGGTRSHGHVLAHSGFASWDPLSNFFSNYF